MKRPGFIIKLIFYIFFICCTIVLISPYIPPSQFPFGNFLSLFVLFVIPLLIFSMIILLLSRQKVLIVINIILILLSIPYFFQLWQFPKDCNLNNGTPFTAITFNTSFFRVPQVFSDTYYDSFDNINGLELIQYITNQTADVICLQEFFNDSRFASYNTIEKMKEKGYEYYFLENSVHNNGIKRGLITFSKHPIIAKGEIFMSQNKYNGASFTDIKIRNDTIRIVNVHLESMELYFSQNGLINKALYGLIQYEQACYRRNIQFEKLIIFIRKSPYPILLMGDFNEIPISNNLKKLNNELDNAFLQAGSGFGTTYSKLYNFIPVRIDHIFFSNTMKATCLQIDKSIKASDHFPVISIISLND